MYFTQFKSPPDDISIAFFYIFVKVILMKVKKTLIDEISAYDAVVITGASSGIGEEFASWVLEASRRSRSHTVVYALSRTRPIFDCESLKWIECDLTDTRALESAVSAIKSDIRSCFQRAPKILLINNSGFGAYGEFPSPSIDRNIDMINLNVAALTRLCADFLPEIKAGRGAIINISSTASFQACPQLSVYAATKAFVLSFSRALREELKERGIFVTAVCPGPVQTEFFDVAERYGSVLGIKKYVMAQPERVVRSALAASCKNRPMSVYGPAMNAFWLMTRLLPQDPVLHLTYRMKKKGECRCADPGKDCQTE